MVRDGVIVVVVVAFIPILSLVAVITFSFQLLSVVDGKDIIRPNFLGDLRYPLENDDVIFGICAIPNKNNSTNHRIDAPIDKKDVVVVVVVVVRFCRITCC
jgi:hypothetical protein